MNACRFAREQKKPVGTFASDGAADAGGNMEIDRAKSLSDRVFPLATPSADKDHGEFIRVWLSNP